MPTKVAADGAIVFLTTGLLWYDSMAPGQIHRFGQLLAGALAIPKSRPGTRGADHLLVPSVGGCR
jgi:hypothetical protein